nr:unnamed protein product [Callosobruchus chinensis]
MHALIEKESEKRKRRKQRFWTSHFLKTRRSTQLLTDLQTADSSGLFKKFCRMSQADFDLLISLIGPRISKQDTNYRECFAFSLLKEESREFNLFFTISTVVPIFLAISLHASCFFNLL